MRSDLVFEVSSRISNRFLLCRMLAASARKMHRDGVSTSQCINRSLLVLQKAPPEVEEDVPREQVSPSETPIVEELATK